MADDDSARERWKKQAGERLAAELRRLNLSQADIARSLSVTKQLSNHWVSGRSEITAWDLTRLARLGIDVNLLLLGKPAQTPGQPVATAPHTPDDAMELLRISRVIAEMAEKFLRGSR